eukprot:11183617-Heterocapsa_arctica.AAC.1
MEAISISFDGKSHVIANTLGQTWRLLTALQQLRRQGRCCGDTLRVDAGHLVHFLLIERAALTVTSEVRHFADKHGRAVASFSLTLDAELRTGAGRLPVLRHNAARSSG